MYCLHCHHDLRDAVSEHCPECGGWFTRDRPETYSRSPGPERLHAILRQASDLLAEAMAAVEPTGAASPIGMAAIVETRAEVAEDAPAADAPVARTVDPATRALAALRRQVMRVSAENWDLRQQVAALTQVLLDRGLVDTIALAAASERAAAMAETPMIVDDTDDLSMADEEADADELTTPELMDLRRAVDSHVLGDT